MNWFQVRRYIWYFFKARHRKGYGIHPPFAFSFVRELIYSNHKFYDFEKIEKYRKKLLANPKMVDVEDFGAGSTVFKIKHRRLSELAKYSGIPVKYGRLLYRIVNEFQPETIVELGTGLGLSTLYMALPQKKATIYTIEGSASLCFEAERTFNKLGVGNVELINNTFDEELPLLLNKLDKIDLAFVDGNHKKNATIDYYNQLVTKAHSDTVLVFDDIHWSEEMEEAWQIICQDERSVITVDLFRCGIVFFKEKFQPQNYLVRF